MTYYVLLSSAVQFTTYEQLKKVFVLHPTLMSWTYAYPRIVLHETWLERT